MGIDTALPGQEYLDIFEVSKNLKNEDIEKYINKIDDDKKGYDGTDKALKPRLPDSSYKQMMLKDNV